jgi:hypothetical protein
MGVDVSLNYGIGVRVDYWRTLIEPLMRLGYLEAINEDDVDQDDVTEAISEYFSSITCEIPSGYEPVDHCFLFINTTSFAEAMQKAPSFVEELHKLDLECSMEGLEVLGDWYYD